ncbi:Pre-mRNA splicing Prp18-interacting factor-domain-containing protein [Phakopsora pachyrhizi]|uniref:Pre-mRNA-splicing factor SLU7 n=1 Tax=Phakopsora pachyrhizi TaxID=170000 RepID=A0AAV0BF52_PHAPC|nr:Pre-mRNA splicing Prp18-interacting factor-domain-containing protein [Phakopsora pachyrhizi]
MATASASAIGKISREEFRRQKDLDAARKAGNAPAEVDEDGNAINPHIPQFMAQAPWYMNTGAPSLKHQKGKEYNADPSKLKEQVARGFKIYSATKYRKGACTNCGAMSHKVIDCLERPRKKGAKWTNQDIAPDEFNAGKKPEDWDGKRDRWDGYDPSEHKKVVEEHQALEQARQKMREEQLDKSTDLKEVKRVARAGKMAKKKTAEEDEFGSSDESDDEDEDKYADAADQAGQKMDTKTRMTVRNLRIREDTAKYLMNLDTESAYYDPKTRSMREAPQKDVPLEDAKFAGDNFQRASAGASDVQKLQLFAWQSEQRGNDVHINANPTQGELLHKEFLKKKEKLKETSKVGILDRYGGEEHLERVPVELMVGQTENYVEYSRTGSVIKGQERAKAKSKYDEDVYPGNHTSVWGSWFSTTKGIWGYSCCHSMTKQSYCTGRAGIEAESREQDLEVDLSSKAQSVNSSNNKSLIEEMEENIRRKAAEVANFGRGGKKRVYGDGDDSGRKEREERLESKKRISDLGEVGKLDRNKLKKAIKDERRRKLMDADQAYDAQKNDDSELTEEQLEAYRLCKDLGHEDPMNDIKGDELLPL